MRLWLYTGHLFVDSWGQLFLFWSVWQMGDGSLIRDNGRNAIYAYVSGQWSTLESTLRGGFIFRLLFLFTVAFSPILRFVHSPIHLFILIGPYFLFGRNKIQSRSAARPAPRSQARRRPIEGMVRLGGD